MTKQSTPLYILRLALTLLAITAVVAAALAGINSVTAPITEKLNYEKTQAAIEAVLPGGGEPLDTFADSTGTVEAVYASEVGYAIQVAPAGFNGKITMMVGIDKAGCVLAIDVISHTETPGLGAVAGADSAKGQAFRQQFAGLSGTVAVTKDGGTVDAITSATITSRAIASGINAALACAEALG